MTGHARATSPTPWPCRAAAAREAARVNCPTTCVAATGSRVPRRCRDFVGRPPLHANSSLRISAPEFRRTPALQRREIGWSLYIGLSGPLPEWRLRASLISAPRAGRSAGWTTVEMPFRFSHPDNLWITEPSRDSAAGIGVRASYLQRYARRLGPGVLSTRRRAPHRRSADVAGAQVRWVGRSTIVIGSSLRVLRADKKKQLLLAS